MLFIPGSQITNYTKGHKYQMAGTSSMQNEDVTSSLIISGRIFKPKIAINKTVNTTTLKMDNS